MHIAGICPEIIVIVCATIYSQDLAVKLLNFTSPVKVAVPTWDDVTYTGLVRSYIFIWTSVNLWPVPPPETRPLAKHAHDYKIPFNLCDHLINMFTCSYFTINHLNTSSKRTRVRRECPFGVILLSLLWNLVVDSLLNFTANDIPSYLQALADDLVWLV